MLKLDQAEKKILVLIIGIYLVVLYILNLRFDQRFGYKISSYGWPFAFYENWGELSDSGNEVVVSSLGEHLTNCQLSVKYIVFNIIAWLFGLWFILVSLFILKKKE